MLQPNRAGILALAFVLGAAAGSAGTWLLCRPRGGPGELVAPAPPADAFPGRGERAADGPVPPARGRGPAGAKDGASAPGPPPEPRPDRPSPSRTGESAASGSPRERLFRAIREKDAAGVRAAVEAGAALDVPVKGRFALHEAIRDGRTGMALLLLELGAPVDRADAQGFTPLLRAVSRGDRKVVEALLARRADVTAAVRGWTPLALALARDAGDLAAALRGAGARLGPVAQARSRLLRACASGDAGLAQAALSEGASATDTDVWGTPALCMAANGHHADVMRLLLDKGARATQPPGRSQPLAHALYAPPSENLTAAVRLLLEAEADPDAFGGLYTPDQRPLHMAAEQGLVEAGRLLLDHGADPELADERGRTALHVSAHEGELGFAELLLRRGADPNAGDGEGRTPLQAAEGRSALEQLLRKYGAR